MEQVLKFWYPEGFFFSKTELSKLKEVIFSNIPSANELIKCNKFDKQFDKNRLRFAFFFTQNFAHYNCWELWRRVGLEHTPNCKIAKKCHNTGNAPN